MYGIKVQLALGPPCYPHEEFRMAASAAQVAYFAKKHEDVTGHVPRRFVCPITLLDDPDVELCDGHILCQRLQSASRSRVIQRADVDNRFGSIVERDFVTFANSRNATPHHILPTTKEFTITSPSGERIAAFFASDGAKVRFPQIEMYDEHGKTIARPYLKSQTLAPGHYKQLQVEWMHYMHKHCFTAAMVKSAYLNMFRILNYAWVYDIAGDKVRRTLLAAHEAEDRKVALDAFSEFEGCCWITGNDDSSDNGDSLSDNRLLFHFAEGDAQQGLLFGVSSLFRINGAQVAVTLPCYNRFGHYFPSWQYYQEFIREQRLRHSIHFGQFVDPNVYISPSPMSFHVVDNLPPKNNFSHILSPFG